MVEKAGTDVEITLRIGDGPDLSRGVMLFRWKSQINEGYSIYAKIIDPNLATFAELANEKYLKEARKKPLEVFFKMKYRVGGDETEERLAFMTDLDAQIPKGNQTAGYFEFIAIDPPTWFLNRGDADGSVWQGRVSDVIRDVIQTYAPGIEVDIGDTDDNKENKWWMMRQDPKTFIMTLLDWSASVTKKRTNWVVASVDKKIIIKEQAELPSEDLGEYAVNAQYPGAENAIKWERLDNNYLSNLQTRVATAGISAVSGLYCDKENSVTEDKVIVEDENTENKKNVNIKVDQGFTKPKKKEFGWTQIRAIPEHSAGEIGIKYQDYIDGRARELFLGVLDMLNRVQIMVYGSPKLDDSSLLGASTVSLLWTDFQDQPWTGNGKHLIYGFEHIYTRSKEWYTYLKVHRRDWDAEAQKV